MRKSLLITIRLKMSRLLAEIPTHLASGKDPQSVLLLLVGFFVATAGLGHLMRVTYAPPSEPILAATSAAVAPRSPISQSQPESPGDWAPAFGSLQHENTLPSPTEPEAAADMEVVSPQPGRPNYQLRGIILDDSQSLALLEGENGTQIVHVGTELANGWTLVEIHQTGVLIGGEDGLAQLTFPESASSRFRPHFSAIERQSQPDTKSEQYLARERSGIHRQLQTVHSRHPQLQPPRFFSMTN